MNMLQIATYVQERAQQSTDAEEVARSEQILELIDEQVGYEDRQKLT